MKNSQVLYCSGMWRCITWWLVTNVLRQDSGLIYKGQNLHSSVTLWEYWHCFKSFSYTVPHPKRRDTPNCTASKVYKLKRRISLEKLSVSWSRNFLTFMKHKAELQALTDLCNSYVLEGPAQVKIVYTYVKLKFKHNGTWWAAVWLPCRLHFHPAVFLNHLCLNVLSFPQGNIWHTLKNVIISIFFLFTYKIPETA